MPWITNIAVITAYCACRLCTPGSGHTASGTHPLEGRTLAASRAIPFGTLAHIEGVGWLKVEDRLARRYDSRWDVYKATHQRARRFGLQTRRVVYWLSPSQAKSAPHRP